MAVMAYHTSRGIATLGSFHEALIQQAPYNIFNLSDYCAKGVLAGITNHYYASPKTILNYGSCWLHSLHSYFAAERSLTMAPTVILIRHAQALHNVNNMSSHLMSGFDADSNYKTMNYMIHPFHSLATNSARSCRSTCRITWKSHKK